MFMNRTRIAEVKSARMLFMVINASEPLNNKLIRQALNYAIDKKAIVADDRGKDRPAGANAGSHSS
jgi:ABC-type transport system substrate-binding protein